MPIKGRKAFSSIQLTSITKFNHSRKFSYSKFQNFSKNESSFGEARVRTSLPREIVCREKGLILEKRQSIPREIKKVRNPSKGCLLNFQHLLSFLSSCQIYSFHICIVLMILEALKAIYLVQLCGCSRNLWLDHVSKYHIMLACSFPLLILWLNIVRLTWPLNLAS